MTGVSATALSATELLGELAAAELEELALDFDLVHVTGGQILFRCGDPADALYIVATGRLHAIVAGECGPIVVREVGRGQNVGELALLTGQPRSATVRAVRDSALYRLSLGSFSRILESRPVAALRLLKMLATWLARSNQPRSAAAPFVTMALIPLGEPGAARSLARDLAAALSSVGRTLHVTAAAVDAELGDRTSEAEPPEPAHARLSSWLDQIESAHRFVVFDASEGGAEWRRRCLRQADRVLGVADTARPSALPLNAAISALPDPERTTAPVDLVMLRPDRFGSVSAATWLASYPFSRHYHVRTGQSSDVERLARHLTGAAVGLVLSGGAARGFAHIGAIRALLEAGVPIDRVGGSSMGAVIAAQHAMGLDPAQMLELNGLWKKHNPLRDLTLPFVSLVSGRGAVRLLEAMFGESQIEDLKIPYFCTSTNLATAELMVHRRGSLAEAARATIAIPGIAPPQRSASGDLLVDGGVLRNLPIDVMRNMGEGPIVAVDVTPSEESAFRIRPGATASPWHFLLSRAGLFKGTDAFPSIYRIMERATVISSVAQARSSREAVALYLTPPVSQFSMFDWTQLERLAETGYEHTARELARVKGSLAASGLQMLAPRPESRKETTGAHG